MIGNELKVYDGLTSRQQLNLFRNLYYNDGNATEYGVIANAINDCLTADVAPKSESEFDSIPVDVAQALKEKAVKKAKSEVAREIFEEIETLLALNTCNGNVFTGKYFDADFENDIAELKKKYTEDKG